MIAALFIYPSAAGQTAPHQTMPQLSINSDILSAQIQAGEYGAISSLWIEQSGQVLFSEYYRGTDEDSFHNMRSVGKTVTGMLLGAAIDDKLIENTNVKAASYFNGLRPFANPDTRKDEITLSHLLTMSSGLECDDFNSFSRGNEERMYLVEDWSKFYWDLPIKNRPSWEIPETDNSYDRFFTYCTAGAQLIGEIVERATGKTAEDYARSRLFAPVGITAPKWNYAATGKAHLGGGLELTTRDWASVARLFVNDGLVNGKSVLSQKWISASMTSYVQAENDTGYGYFLWRPDYQVQGQSYTANMMSGTGGNRIYILPEFDITVVITKMITAPEMAIAHQMPFLKRRSPPVLGSDLRWGVLG